MSQSLIIFDVSGKVRYQYDNKIISFNSHISAIANETCTSLDSQFLSSSSNQKRYYSFSEKDLYSCLYIDSVTTIDSEKIRKALSDILKIYNNVIDKEDEDSPTAKNKLKSLINFQFENLIKKSENVDNGSAEVLAEEHKRTTMQTQKKRNAGQSKKMRKWYNGELVEDNPNLEALDFSNQNEDADDSYNYDLLAAKDAFKESDNMRIVDEINEILDNNSTEDEHSVVNSKTSRVDLLSKFTSLFGNNVSIDEVSKKFHDQLVSKNISYSTATTIINRIKQRIGNKTKVSVSEFKDALSDELTKILTPNVSTDLLYEIKARKGKDPYVISVVGVNGVGKSTNLAKLAYWFLQNNLNVLICACDTFRSGAVEQLKVHVNNLKRLNDGATNHSSIDIFEKGYGGGDHVVTTAKAAIQYAKENSFDIVLIDTAGRTHSNAKLMGSLKKFGDAANPDKIIMVGEALVGTDSVEQAINFNNAFGNNRGLNFFIISKVDTVGDLVGSMINMVMATNVPILFVGTGQTYTDIKRLSVKVVVNMLVS